METNAFSLLIQTENHLIAKGAESRRVLELTLSAPLSKAQEKRDAINLALVLDRSGSMHGEKLEYVRQAAGHVLDLLADGDRAAVVAFDDQVLLVAESTAVTRSSRSMLKQRLDMIRSGGSTNLSEGWLRGCEQVSRQMNGAAQINRVLLLTDGRANAGITDLEALAVHARELAERGVSTSTFGVGAGFNEHLLESMAQQGQGSFYFIAAPSDIPLIFTQEFEELSAVTARDVEVEITLPAGVDADVLGGLRCERAGEKLRVFLGSLVGGREQGIYLDLRFPPSAGSEDLVLKAVARAKGSNDQVLEAEGKLVFQYADEATVESGQVLKELLERAAQVRVSYLAGEALKLERKGQTEQAAGMLETALQADRAHLSADQVKYHEDLAHRMRRGLEEDDRKSAHYSSYLGKRQRLDPTFEMRRGMLDSSTMVQQMMMNRRLRMHETQILSSSPDSLPADFQFDRIEGMLLGVAVGDALANTTESMTSEQRRGLFGEITGYLPNRFAGDQPAGVPSDDTQMTFWTLESLLLEGRLDPQALAHRFTRERIFGIGSGVLEFLRNYKDRHMPWHEAGVESAGTGALMRITPVLLPHLKRPSNNLWADAALAGMITHNDFASNASCVAFIAIIWDLLGMQKPPLPEWWAATYGYWAEQLEGPAAYRSRMPGVNYQGPVSLYARYEVERALNSGWTVAHASKQWGSGAYLLEAVPNVLYILSRYADDPEQAILRAVNDTYDNDTIAALVGAAVGALHGKAALPERWLKGLLGRTNDRNDGHIFRLIDQARAEFWGK